MNIEKVGLVIEGGGMRGIFSSGVLDYLIEMKKEFPYVIGVSMGACNGSTYVSKQKERNLRIPMTYLNDNRYLSFRNLIKEGNIFGMDFLFKEIPYILDPFDFEVFEKSNQRFIAVTTSCKTGKATYFEKENNSREAFLEILAASSSLPFLSTLKKIDGDVYLDGGISDSIPVVKTINDGYFKQVIILTREYDYMKKTSKFVKVLAPIYYKKYPNLANSIINRANEYNKTVDIIKEQEELGNFFVIRPENPIEISRIEKNKKKLKKTYNLGYERMKTLYEDMNLFLGK
jgi:predicted patatin/cPLA2 family phospholipase